MRITSGQLAELKELAKTADGMKSDDWMSYRLGDPDRTERGNEALS